MSDLSGEALARFSKLFEVLDEAGRKALLGLSKKLSVPSGQVICREGEDGDTFFVVTHGRLKVTGDNLGEEKELGVLEAGQFFGEVALLSGQKRQATVTAIGPVEVVAFPKSAVDTVLKANPKAKELLQKVGLSRTEDSLQKLIS